MTRPRNPFNRPVPGTPNGVPLIGQGIQQIPGRLQAMPHWLSEPVSLELPGPVPDGKGGVIQGMIKYTWGGYTKRLEIAKTILAQLALDVPHNAGEEPSTTDLQAQQAVCRKALDLADMLLEMDRQDVEDAQAALEAEAKAREQSEGGEAGSSEQ